MQPKVSVIVPAYNVEKVIDQSLRSLLGQTYPNIEIICVNDGSTDRSAEMLDYFAKTYPHITVIHQANQGQCIASNAALKVATGDYIKFFDADDIMNPEHIGLQVQRMDNRTDAVCSCEWGRFFNDDITSARFLPETVWRDMKPIDWLKSALRQKSDMMGAWLWLIPKKLIDKSGGWDERLSYCPNNDFEFSIRLLLNSNDVLFTAGAKVFYRTGDSNSLSAKTTKAAYESILLATDLGCDHLLKRENSAEMRRLCANRYQGWVYTIYPHYPDLVKRTEQKIASLGGSSIKMKSGIFFNVVRELIGWRLAKRMQLLVYRYKLNR